MLYYICLMIAFVALAAYTIYLLLKFRDYSSPKEVEELYDEIDGKIKGLLSKMETNAKAEISKLEKESTIYINCVCNNKPKAKLYTRKPIEPTELEIKENKRSRSAKLRVCIKL